MARIVKVKTSPAASLKTHHLHIYAETQHEAVHLKSNSCLPALQFLQPVMFQWGMLMLVTLVLVSNTRASDVRFRNENRVKSAVFHSPVFTLEPGSVSNKFYRDINFPRGHIALKDLYAEVVDELGNSVPLHETYLHHWLINRYYALVVDGQETRTIKAGNSGICGNTLSQYFGLGSETRKTISYIPDPYGIVVGNPDEIPERYEERWLLNVHAIDTRGVEDRLRCTECLCDLYNVTMDEYRRPLRSGYTGGLYCCYDDTHCRVKNGVESVKRNLYLRYTVKWIDWNEAILPVKIYILDVTDTGKRSGGDNSLGLGAQSGCQVEYQVEPCGISGTTCNGCIDNKRTSVVMPNGGYVIYGVAHQHTGGTGAALYREDGSTICTSLPIYGEGKEAGNETGYVVGMSTCYPQPGSVKISDGETLLVESNYSRNNGGHTGVMGFIYLLVADQPPKHTLSLRDPLHFLMHEKVKSRYSWALAFVGIAITVAAVVVYRRRSEREEGYQSI